MVTSEEEAYSRTLRLEVSRRVSCTFYTHTSRLFKKLPTTEYQISLEQYGKINHHDRLCKEEPIQINWSHREVAEVFNRLRPTPHSCVAKLVAHVQQDTAVRRAD